MILLIKGQCPSGKNSVTVTRSGHRYPNERFKTWRDLAVWDVKQQIKKLDVDTPIDVPVSVSISYIAQDRRRRDVPGIIDAIWHVLEKAGVIKDDSLLGGLGCYVNFKFAGIDKNKPEVQIII